MSSITKQEFKAGMILMWSGLISTIPSGWFLCDGSNGTPDLRNRMIVCADADSGGAAKTTITGAATQSGGNANHTNTIAEMVSHNHTLVAINGGGTGGGGTGTYLGDVDFNEGTPNQTMTGTINNQGGSTAYSILNPYYALAFIMKI